MRRWFKLCFGLLVLASLWSATSGTAHAQAPAGSYRGSCRQISFQTPTLNASCKDDDGDWHQTKLDVTACTGDIFNDANGQLRCTAAPIPKGSYQQSCRDAIVVGTTLEATCKSNSGAWRRTSLDTTRCRGDIFNGASGELGCTAGPIVGGSYQQSCRDFVMDGTVLNASCKANNGDWRQTSIDTRVCKGDIFNNAAGRLDCTQGPLPAGSYKQSCRDEVVRGDTLLAVCKTNEGRWVQASMKLNACSRDIWNDSLGTLRCASTGPVPGGSYTQTCKDPDINGTVLSAWCRSNGGDYRFVSLNTQGCSNDIYNDPAGQLRCATSSSSGQGSSTGQPGSTARTKSVCAGSNLNPNWVIIDNPTASLQGCPGGPHNTWLVENVASLPLGSQVSVCAGQAPPPGWKDIGGVRLPTVCYLPDMTGQNVRTFFHVSNG